MAATTQDLSIERGATLSETLSVTSSTGKTYRAKLVDRFWCVISDLTVTVVDSTNVKVSLTAEETADLALPAHIRHDERSARLGYWDLEEVDGSTVARLYQGVVTISREATR